MEKTLVLIKPDAVERGLTEEILKIYDSVEGITIIDKKQVQATREIAAKHYFEHEGRPYFEDLMEFITRSPIDALIIEGENVIKKVREINGATDPKLAEEGTIRNKFALSKNENCVHASDSIESAAREIGIWFS